MNPIDRTYNEVVEYLDDQYAFFLTHVLNLGAPQYSETIPTACVMVDFDTKKDSIDKDFRFLFNPTFLQSLSTEDAAFVFSHETILLNHLALVRNFVDADKYGPLARKANERQPLTKDEKAFLAAEGIKAQVLNVAADCVINDYLVSAGFTGPEGLIYGMNNVGYNCAHSTVTDVYNDLMQKVQQQMQSPDCPSCGGTGEKQKDDGEGGDDGDQGDGGAGDAHGNGTGEPCPDCQGSGKGQPGNGVPQIGNGTAIDSHDWLYDATKEMIDAVDKMYEDLKDQMPTEMDDMKADQAATTNMDGFNAPPGTERGNLQKFLKENGVTLAWIDLLKEVDPDMFKGKGDGPKPRPSFHRPRRKLAAFPDVNLPVIRDDERNKAKSKKKPAIVMALDTSGSISQQDRSRFISLAQSVPQDKLHLFPITFTTDYLELDLENPQFRSGGTDFGCIQRYVNKVVKPQLDGDYPQAIVVITDGEAYFGSTPDTCPNEKESDSWFWLLTDRHSLYCVDKVGKKKNLKDFIQFN
jgi:Putative metallopeptidase domain